MLSPHIPGCAKGYTELLGRWLTLGQWSLKKEELFFISLGPYDSGYHGEK